jgi:membrane-bound ClpP family serine protease
MLMIAGAILLALLLLLLLPVVLLLGAATFLFGLLLVLATFVAWGLWATSAYSGIEVSHYMTAAAVALGVVGILAVRARDRVERRPTETLSRHR